MMAGMHDVMDGEILANDRQVSGAWLPPAAAASRLGVSERTLWRLVKAGRYHRRIVDRKAMILVPLPDTGATPGEPSLPDTTIAPVSGIVSGVTDSAVLAIVDELKRQAESSLALIAQQAETIGTLRAENQALRAAQVSLHSHPPPYGACGLSGGRF
jgi:hypothetical protein